MILAELDLNKVYTYTDYFNWTFEERVELINGKVFQMDIESNFNHQVLVGEIFRQFANFLKKQSYRAFVAPFDVRLPKKSNEDKDIFTVLQPDVCVVCDTSKYDTRGCIGAPDTVITNVLPGFSMDLKELFDMLN